MDLLAVEAQARKAKLHALMINPRETQFMTRLRRASVVVSDTNPDSECQRLHHAYKRTRSRHRDARGYVEKVFTANEIKWNFARAELRSTNRVNNCVNAES